MIRQRVQPHLFTVRVWLEELDDGQFDCRGRVQHGLHGNPQHFQGWSALIDLMTDVMDAGGKIDLRAESGLPPHEYETDRSELDTD